MFIKRLELKNFQVIEDFNADFEGNVYFITGDNERGKSTVLKSIGILLTGNRDAVLQNGKEKGFAKMVIGDDGENYEVDLKFTKANPRGTLTIKSEQTGLKSDSVTMLQKIFGYTDFDAVEFSRWSETAEGRRKQIEVVKSLLPKDVQTRIAEIDEEIKTTKDLRKDKNSEVKTFTTICDNAAKGLQPGDVKVYANKIDITYLMEEQAENAKLIEKAKTVRQAIETRTQQLAEIPQRLQKAESDFSQTIAQVNQSDADAKIEYDRIISEAKQKFDSVKKSNKEKIKEAEAAQKTTVETIQNEKLDYETRKANAEKWLAEYEANNPEETNTTEQLKKAEEHNEKNKKVVDYLEKKDQKEKAEKEAEKHDNKINELTKEREKLIESSELPIEGLTFTDDGLELNGVPFVAGKVSDSQTMEVAAKLIIASNPTVKVFRIARGESLGEKRLQAIIDIAQKNGFQGFIEEVKRGQDDLIVEEYTEE